MLNNRGARMLQLLGIKVIATQDGPIFPEIAKGLETCDDSIACNDISVVSLEIVDATIDYSTTEIADEEATFLNEHSVTLNKDLFEVSPELGQDIEQNPESSTKRSKRKYVKHQSNKKIENKNKRMKGEKYIGYKRVAKKISHDQPRETRKMGPTCSSEFCKKSKLRKCCNVSEFERQKLFKSFWELTWDKKKILVLSCCSQISKNKTTAASTSRRKFTYRYNLIIDSIKIPVCKPMFLSTFGLKEWMLHNWVNAGTHLLDKQELTLCQSERSSLRLSNEQKLKFLKEFLNNLEKMDSHYCRQSSAKMYVETFFESKADVYKAYQVFCTESNESPLSSCVFAQTFEQMNLAIFRPRKDQCDTCCMYKEGNITDGEYTEHIIKKDLARNEKLADKILAEKMQADVYTMDVQAVKTCPKLNASALYFKQKLQVHNFTIYNLRSHECTNYWWNECEADLQASTFTSCIIQHLQENFVRNRKIIIYSDGCGYQNRNAILSNALLCLAVENKIVIEQKFLEKGHTQMECDAVHSIIERKLKHRSIYLPFEYNEITLKAREKPFPLSSIYLTHDFFYDYSYNLKYKSIRPGRKVHDSTVADIRALMYNIDGKILYKLNHSDQYTEIPGRTIKNIALKKPTKKLFKSQLKISKNKYKHLQELKCVLPVDAHHFYDNLPYEQ